MESLAKLRSRRQPPNISVNHRRPSLPKSSSSISFKTPSSPFKSTSIRASTSSSNHQNHKPSSSIIHQTLNHPIVKSTCITITVATTLCFMSLYLAKPAIAAPQFVPVTSSTDKTNGNENLPIEEQEMVIEEELGCDSENVEALKSLMEVKIKLGKVPEAIQAIDRLIKVEPEEKEWPMLKALIYSYSGDFVAAKKGFEEILVKGPIRVDAYSGLLMT